MVVSLRLCEMAKEIDAKSSRYFILLILPSCYGFYALAIHRILSWSCNDLHQFISNPRGPSPHFQSIMMRSSQSQSFWATGSQQLRAIWFTDSHIASPYASQDSNRWRLKLSVTGYSYWLSDVVMTWLDLSIIESELSSGQMCNVSGRLVKMTHQSKGTTIWTICCGLAGESCHTGGQSSHTLHCWVNESKIP